MADPSHAFFRRSGRIRKNPNVRWSGVVPYSQSCLTLTRKVQRLPEAAFGQIFDLRLSKIRLQSGQQKEVKTKSQQVTHQQQTRRLVRGRAGSDFYQQTVVNRMGCCAREVDSGYTSTGTNVNPGETYARKSSSPCARPDLDCWIWWPPSLLQKLL